MSLLIRREAPRPISSDDLNAQVRIKVLKGSIFHLKDIDECKSSSLYMNHAIQWLNCKISGEPFVVTWEKVPSFQELNAWVKTMDKVIVLAIERSLGGEIEFHQKCVGIFENGIEVGETEVEELSSEPGNDSVIERKRIEVESAKRCLLLTEKKLKIVLAIGKDLRSLIE